MFFLLALLTGGCSVLSSVLLFSPEFWDLFVLVPWAIGLALGYLFVKLARRLWREPQ